MNYHDLFAVISDQETLSFFTSVNTESTQSRYPGSVCYELKDTSTTCDTLFDLCEPYLEHHILFKKADSVIADSNTSVMPEIVLDQVREPPTPLLDADEDEEEEEEEALP